MKLESKYFDSIRVAPKRQREEAAAKRHPCCQWKGCERPARYRAPKGRGKDGQYYLFCVDHVRQYNASYNYFDGMSDAEVVDFQKDALTGHRPTWKVGVNGDAGVRRPETRWTDPHGFFAWRNGRSREAAPEPRRALKRLEKKSLEALHLDVSATRTEIKARFKMLVKRHHPDANGGDTRSEGKLREIIQAYNYLKRAGLV